MVLVVVVVMLEWMIVCHEEMQEIYSASPTQATINLSTEFSPATSG